MDDIKTMWQKRLPIAVIATKHQLKRKDVIAELGDLYSKNEAHYRANEYRDAQRLTNFAKWYDEHFNLAELQDAINSGTLQSYWQAIAKPEKLTVSAVRDFVTNKLGALPERTTSRAKYDPETYKLGAKSAYFGREPELIAMWRDKHMSIEAISRETGVSKRALNKLLKPQGYDSHDIRSRIAKEQSEIRKTTKLSSDTHETKLVYSLMNEHSAYTEKVLALLQSLGVKFEVHNRSLGFELDFYLPELKLAIECSPLATHNSNLFRQDDTLFKPKTSNYHYNKYKVARQNGITLITLFEKQFVPDVWTNKTVPMLHRLVTGHADVTLYARQIDIRLMSQPNDKKLADAF